jgi:hypothetical protein
VLLNTVARHSGTRYGGFTGSEAREGYPGQSNLLHGVAKFYGAKQSSTRRCKVPWEKTSFPEPLQSYPEQNNVPYAVVRFSREKKVLHAVATFST